MTKLIREKDYQDWVRKHPEKAASYAQHDPHMKQAYEEWQSVLPSRLGRIVRKSRHYYRKTKRLFRKLSSKPLTPEEKKREEEEDEEDEDQNQSSQQQRDKRRSRIREKLRNWRRQ